MERNMHVDKRNSQIYHNIAKNRVYPIEGLTFIRQIGQGAFGQVDLAEAHGIVEDGVMTLVAVKTVSGNLYLCLFCAAKTLCLPIIYLAVFAFLSCCFPVFSSFLLFPSPWSGIYIHTDMVCCDHRGGHNRPYPYAPWCNTDLLETPYSFGTISVETIPPVGTFQR